MSQAEYAIGDMLVHEANPTTGELIVESNGSLKPAKNQPIVSFYKNLNNMKVTGGKDSPI